MKPPPINVCEANVLVCPNPLCEKRVGTRAVFKGYVVDQCPFCSTNYMAWATLGVANIRGLTPEQAASVDPEEDRLVMVMRKLGWLKRGAA